MFPSPSRTSSNYSTLAGSVVPSGTNTGYHSASPTRPSSSFLQRSFPQSNTPQSQLATPVLPSTPGSQSYGNHPPLSQFFSSSVDQLPRPVTSRYVHASIDMSNIIASAGDTDESDTEQTVSREYKFSTMQTPHPQSAQASNNTSQEQKSRLANLKEKLAELDGDIQSSYQSRASKDARVSSLNDSLKVIQSRLNQVEKRNADLEEHVRALSAALVVEKSARETVEKTLHNMRGLDERTSNLSRQLAEVIRTVGNESEALRARMVTSEEQLNSVRSAIEREIKARTDLESTTVAKLSDGLTVLAKEMHRERHVRSEETESVKKSLADAVSTLQTAMDDERITRDKQHDKFTETLRQQSETAAEALHDVKKQFEKTLHSNMASLKEQLTELRAICSPDSEEMNRRSKEAAGAINSVLTRAQEMVTSLKGQFVAEQKELETRLAKEVRVLDDRVWKLAETVQSEVQAREMDAHKVVELLAVEKAERMAEASEVTMLIERSIEQMRRGLQECG